MFHLFAISQGVETLLLLAGASILGGAVLGIVRAAVKLLQNRQAEQRQEEFDERTLAEFFFDTERDPRTGAPAKKGWTTRVDETLAFLTQGQHATTKELAETRRLVNKILYELEPNGGGNFRGAVERATGTSDTDGTDGAT